MQFQKKLSIDENYVLWFFTGNWKSLRWRCHDIKNPFMYYMLQTALKEYDKDCNPITVQKIQMACVKSNKLFQKVECRLDSIYLYYYFSDIENKYHGNLLKI